jgi:hypothetical protein
LNNLKVSNPAAFKAVSEFVNAPQHDFPQLPPSSTIFGEAPKQTETPMKVESAKPQLYRSKTGLECRIQTTRTL